jgi:peptide deformylase
MPEISKEASEPTAKRTPRPLNIIKFDSPEGSILRRKALRVTDPRGEGIQPLIDDMLVTLGDQAFGLAAPQVGFPLRIMIVSSRPIPGRFPNAPIMPPTVMINPSISSRSGVPELGWEGCLSIPGKRANVLRAPRITAAFTDRHGGHVVMELVDLAARAFQHELDHLNGVLILDLVNPADVIGEEAFQELMAKNRQAEAAKNEEGLPS